MALLMVKTPLSFIIAGICRLTDHLFFLAPAISILGMFTFVSVRHSINREYRRSLLLALLAITWPGVDTTDFSRETHHVFSRYIPYPLDGLDMNLLHRIG